MENINFFRKINLLYLFIFIVGILIIVVNRVLVGFNNILWMIDFASFFSLLYVIFTAKHSIFGLVFDLLATLVMVATNSIQHLWLSLAVCVLICVPNLTIGIFKWRRNQKINDSLNLKKLSKKHFTLVFCLYIVVSVVFAIILFYLNGNLFYLDAFYSAGCALGVILSSFAFIDQFYVYLFVDIVFGLPMYTMLTIQNINNITMIFTTLVFIMGSIVGLINWKKLDKSFKQEESYNKEKYKAG